MLVLKNLDLHDYLFSHPEPKPSGHRKYNVMNNVGGHASYTTKHLRSWVLNKIHIVNWLPRNTMWSVMLVLNHVKMITKEHYSWV